MGKRTRSATRPPPRHAALPFVRRRRLATELRTLREQSGMTADELAGRIYRSRMTVSKLENARTRPDVRDIVQMLRILGVTGEKFDEIFKIACDAADRGWWDSYGDAMGPRQRIYADLESGAATIRGYNQFVVPGLLQTPEFIRALVSLDEADGPLNYVPERMLEARLIRQSTALRQGGPTYEIVMDEFVIRRLAVPPKIMSSQLHELVSAVTREPRLKIYVLPVNARIQGGFSARSSFTIYTFPDAEDPVIALADTAKADVVHIDPADVTRYVEMYERLRAASLSAVRSLTLLEETACELANLAGS
ncbi:helix-turn-helix transcriptional regulator [Actinomadura chokoriensis]|uniref:helix-turn-helix domain-containing protein n=1 Tax=Actinomadura chokoriensis TaxID=454156 RepID=UPI0031F9026D